MKDFVDELKLHCARSENHSFNGEYYSWQICRKKNRDWFQEIDPVFARDILTKNFKEDGFYAAWFFPKDMDYVTGLIECHILDGVITQHGIHKAIETDNFVFLITNSSKHYKRLLIISHAPF